MFSWSFLVCWKERFHHRNWLVFVQHKFRNNDKDLSDKAEIFGRFFGYIWIFFDLGVVKKIWRIWLICQNLVLMILVFCYKNVSFCDRNRFATAVSDNLRLCSSRWSYTVQSQCNSHGSRRDPIPADHPIRTGSDRISCPFLPLQSSTGLKQDLTGFPVPFLPVQSLVQD